MDINLLVKVSAKAWSFDVLAILSDGTAGRQASLISKTGAGRTAVQNSLNHLIELGLVARNSGHGHPLRPEYILTSLGKRCGKTALDIKNLVPVASNRLILNRTWTLPVLATSVEPIYFSEIKSKLPRITDRALSQSIKSLEDQNWMHRHVDTSLRPPRPVYQTCDTGALLGQSLSQFNSI